MSYAAGPGVTILNVGRVVLPLSVTLVDEFGFPIDLSDTPYCAGPGVLAQSYDALPRSSRPFKPTAGPVL